LFNIISTYPENPLNKYNRRLDRAFIDRRSYVFAVIMANPGSDKVSLHRVVRNLAQPRVPRGVARIKRNGENKKGIALGDEKMAELHTIKAQLYDNALTENPNDFIARVTSERSRT
jgi:hypothetical protein